MIIPKSLECNIRPPAGHDQVNNFRLSANSLSAQAVSFYMHTDGLRIPDLGTEVLSLAEAKKYAKAIQSLPISLFYCLLPITESNNSSPYCLILGPKLNGAVLHLSHAGGVSVTHSSLQSFLHALASTLEKGSDLIDDLAAEEITEQRLVNEADSLISSLLDKEEPDFENILPLISVCSSHSLITLLEAEDMWVREEAALRCGRLVIPEARESLQSMANAGKGQDARAAKQSLSHINKALFGSNA